MTRPATARALTRLLLALLLALGAFAGLTVPAGAALDNDLVIHAFTTPNSVQNGNDFSVDVVVRVRGAANATANIRVYLSTNKAIDSGDTLVDECTNESIPVNTLVTCSLSDITAPTSPGRYYLIAEVQHVSTSTTDPRPQNNVRVVRLQVL